MTMQVSCAKCRHVIDAEEPYFGKTVKCPNCQAHVKIPVPAKPAAKPAPSQPTPAKPAAAAKAESLGPARRKEKKRSLATVLMGVVPTLIILGVLAFVLVPKWKRQLAEEREPAVERVVKKTYMYKGGEYTAEQLKAIGIDPKTGKAIHEPAGKRGAEAKEGGTEEVVRTEAKPSKEAVPKEAATPPAPKPARKFTPIVLKRPGRRTAPEPVPAEQKPERKSAAVAPPPETKAPAPAEPEAAGTVDLGKYADDIKPVDDLIDAMKYADARSRANLLKGKYPEMIATKLANLRQIETLHKRCVDRINSGAAKLKMGDLSKKYSFAGEIKKADEKGLTAKIKKKWGSFSREEIARFYRMASDPKSADDLAGLAAFLSEGNVDLAGLDTALIPLGKAAGMGSDVTAVVEYVEKLKKMRRQSAKVEVAEAGRKEANAATPHRAAGIHLQKKTTEGLAARETDAVKGQTVKYDGVYVTKAATGDEIPHPLSRKTYTMHYKGKRTEIPEGMVFVPPGVFLMGRNENQKRTGLVQKQVYLDAYFLGKYEVTNAEYKAFVDATGHAPPRHWEGGRIPDGKENHPVVDVSWEDAKAYCDWCGKRLPTEAEWEKAAAWDMKRKRQRTYPWGDVFDPRRANHCYQLGCRCNGNTVAHAAWLKKWIDSPEGQKMKSAGGNTSAVGEFKGDESFFRCFDMGGNAQEWVSDWYQEDYYQVGPNKNPKGATEEEAPLIETASIRGVRCRVRRGGYWSYQRSYLNTAMRFYHRPDARNDTFGFRCAADYPWKAPALVASLRTVRPRETKEAPVRETRKEKPRRGRALIVRQDGKGRFRTIQEAIDAAKDGATIQITDAKVYSQPTIDGTSKRGITLRGSKKSMPTLRWAKMDSSEPTNWQTIASILKLGPDWTIEGIRFENTEPTYKIYATTTEVAGNCTARNCWFKGILSNNWPEAGNCVIENCVFEKCDVAVGLTAASEDSQLTFANNIVRGCKNGLMYSRTPNEPKVIVTRSIFTDIRSQVFRIMTLEQGREQERFRLASDYNCFFGVGKYREGYQKGAVAIKTLQDWQKDSGQDGHSIEADPQFVDPAKSDLRLDRKSPCRASGPKKTDMGVDWRVFPGAK